LKLFLAMIAKDAAKHGLDLSTREGRREFAALFERERTRVAQQMRFDLKKEDDRHAFNRFIEKENRKLASEHHFDLKTREGRAELDRFLLSHNRYSHFSMDRLAHNFRFDDHRGPASAMPHNPAPPSAGTAAANSPPGSGWNGGNSSGAQGWSGGYDNSRIPNQANNAQPEGPQNGNALGFNQFNSYRANNNTRRSGH
jgi:hypothetical protein